MGYKILETDLPEALRNKPRCVSCITFTATVLVTTLLAITVGAILGYTYCYIEHHTGGITGNVTKLTNLQVLHDTEEAKHNKTINGALMSSMVLSRILMIGRALMNNDKEGVPFSGKEQSSDRVLKSKL